MFAVISNDRNANWLCDGSLEQALSIGGGVPAAAQLPQQHAKAVHVCRRARGLPHHHLRRLRIPIPARRQLLLLVDSLVLLTSRMPPSQQARSHAPPAERDMWRQTWHAADSTQRHGSHAPTLTAKMLCAE